MIDLKDLLKNPDFYKKASKNKGVDLDKDIDELIIKKKYLNKILSERDKLRAELNKLSKRKPTAEEIINLKRIKNKIKKIEQKINNLEDDIEKLLRKIPNPPLNDVPIGASDKDNKIIKYNGEIRNKEKDYLSLAFQLDLIDINRASKITGTRFAFLKNKLVLLQFAIIQFVFEKLTNQNFLEKVISKYNLNVSSRVFVPILPPVFVKKEIMQDLGYLDSGLIDFFEINNTNFFLIGTAEHSLVSYFKDEILEENNLPIRFLGFSSCFRKEAGSYGKDTKGIFRVHQFDKIEMVSFSLPEISLNELFFLLAIEEELMQLLELPYRVIERCSADLGHPTAKGFDIEVWLPSEKRYRETHSCSITTDYQARRLNIRLKRKGKLYYPHILNATAFALGRILIAIIENYQENGKIKIPSILVNYTKFDEI